MGVAIINKVLNNNVVIANHPSYGETVIIGKGIGFNRKKDDEISLVNADKMFVLTGKKEQEDIKNYFQKSMKNTKELSSKR